MGKMLGNLRDQHHPDDAVSQHQPVDHPRHDVPLPAEIEPGTVEQPESHALQEIRHALAPVSESVAHFKAIAMTMGHVMEQVAAAYKAPIYHTYTMAPTNHPYVVRDESRNHLAAFVAAAQSIQLMIPGIGAGIPYNLVAGWNQLDFPALTEITTAAVNGFNVLFVYANDRTANA